MGYLGGLSSTGTQLLSPIQPFNIDSAGHQVFLLSQFRQLVQVACPICPILLVEINIELCVRDILTGMHSGLPSMPNIFNIANMLVEIHIELCVKDIPTGMHSGLPDMFNGILAYRYISYQPKSTLSCVKDIPTGMHSGLPNMRCSSQSWRTAVAGTSIAGAISHSSWSTLPANIFTFSSGRINCRDGGHYIPHPYLLIVDKLISNNFYLGAVVLASVLFSSLVRSQSEISV